MAIATGTAANPNTNSGFFILLTPVIRTVGITAEAHPASCDLTFVLVVLWPAILAVAGAIAGQ